MTLPSSVLSALRFWDTTSTPQTTWNVTGVTSELPSTVSAGDQSTIIGALEVLYAGSTTFREMIDDYIDPLGENELIRIGSSTSVTVGAAKRGGSIDEYVVFDLADVPLLYYFAENGELVQERIELAIAHELLHNVYDINDTIPANEATMNGAAYDFMGEVLRKQKEISNDLGVQVQISYDAFVLSSDALFNQFRTGFSYSRGGEIDIARLGTTANDSLNHSNRTDGSVDLLFGLGGEDTMNGGDGDDHLWGGGHRLILVYQHHASYPGLDTGLLD